MVSDDITLILILATIIWISPFISKVFYIPTSLVEILMGSFLATFGIIKENVYFNLVAEVGFLYLMFLAGMEVDLNKLLNSSADLLRKSALYIFLISILSLIAGYILNFNAIYIVSLPLISIGLLATLSKIYGKDQKWLEIAFIVGVLGEIVSIIALTILDAASEVGFGFELIKKLSILFGFIILIVFIYKLLDLLFWWSPEIKDKLMPDNDTSEQDIRLSISLFFILIVVMIWLHLELALGAFIAGVAISAFFHHKKELEEKMSSFGFGFLIPLFFIHVGKTFDINSIKYDGVFKDAILIITLSMGIKIVSALILKKYLTAKEAILMGLSLSMPLTLLVAVATIGKETKYLTILQYYSLIFAAIAEILIAMIAIKILIRKKDLFNFNFKKSSKC